MSHSTDNSRNEKRGQIPLRQGDIVEIDANRIPDFPPTGMESLVSPFLALVASHDCDIDASAEKDPLIEFFSLKTIERLDSTKTHTKNARSLHFTAKTSTGAERYFEVEAPKKFAIMKASLWEHEFSSECFLTRDERYELANWLAVRYQRAALPNQFERRYAKVRERFWRLISKFNYSISTVLFIFDEGQEDRNCDENEPYTLTILLIHPEGTVTSDFEILISSIHTLFETSYGNESPDQNAGIELRRCAAISENALSMATYRTAFHHRIDWISYGSEPQGPRL